jgi:1,4-dihydroxy-2-naphthoyl-CoA synthase
MRRHVRRGFASLQEVCFPRSDRLRATNWETLRVSVDAGVCNLYLNRPEVANAINMSMWGELIEVFTSIDECSDVRCVVLRGEGAVWSAGMDLSVFSELAGMHAAEPCEARSREALSRSIDHFQRAISAPEKCRVPVIAAIAGGCIGGGVDLATACDLRYAAAGALSFMYRYIPRETCSQFDSLPLTYLALLSRRRATSATPRQMPASA